MYTYLYIYIYIYTYIYMVYALCTHGYMYIYDTRGALRWAILSVTTSNFDLPIFMCIYIYRERERWDREREREYIYIHICIYICFYIHTDDAPRRRAGCRRGGTRSRRGGSQHSLSFCRGKYPMYVTHHLLRIYDYIYLRDLIHVCMYVYIYIYTYTYTYALCVYIYICIHNMHKCIYIYTASYVII